MVPDDQAAVPGLDLYEIFDTSDMPPGVVNLLSGDKRHLTKHLCEHQQVSALWYLCDADGDELRGDEKSAVQFVKYTSAFNLKSVFVAPTRVQVDEEKKTVRRAYLDEITANSSQLKIIHAPMGTIFAN